MVVSDSSNNYRFYQGTVYAEKKAHREEREEDTEILASIKLIKKNRHPGQPWVSEHRRQEPLILTWLCLARNIRLNGLHAGLTHERLVRIELPIKEETRFKLGQL